VLPSRFELGLRTGAVVASATAGVLVAIGHAAGDIFFPFAAGGHLLLGSVARVPWVFVMAGLARHVVLHLGAATLFTWFAGRLRRGPLALAAAGAGALVWVVGPRFPDAIRPVALDLLPAEGVIYCLTLAGALAAGVLLGAFPARADDGRGISKRNPDSSSAT